MKFLLYFSSSVVAVAIRAGVPASDMKLITALLFLIILALGGMEKRRVKKHA